jgi:hypothetical protein
LIDIGGPLHFLFVVGCGILAMGTFVAASQNWLITRNRWYETVALLVICFTLFRPDYWLDQIQQPFVERPAGEIVKVAGEASRGSTIRVRVKSSSPTGEDVEKVVRLTMRSGEGGTERLAQAGLVVGPQGEALQSVRFGSEAAKYRLMAGDQILAVLVPAERISRFWFTIPALILLAGIIVLQRRRKSQKLVLAASG